MSKNYVIMYTKVACTMGCMQNSLNVGVDHGVYKMEGGSTTYPVMNAGDNQAQINIPNFGTCTSTQAPCQPTIVTPWFNTNETNRLEKKGCLTDASKLACVKGGIISIVPE